MTEKNDSPMTRQGKPRTSEQISEAHKTTRQPPRQALLDTRLVERWSRIPPGRPIVIRDTQVRGFSVRIGASGAISYLLQYVDPHGKQRLYTITLPDDSSDPRPFRHEAERIKYAREKNPDYDPLADRRAGQDEAAKAKRNAKTFADVCAKWIERRSADKRSFKDDRSLLEKYLIPRLGGTPLARLSTDQVRELHRELSAHAPYQANRVLALISALWGFAGDGIRPRRGSSRRIEGLHWLKPGLPNPTAGIERNEEERRERTLTPDEFARLSAVLRAEANSPSAHALALLTLTAARRSEVLKAEWSQFDLEGAIWRRSVTKADKIARLPVSADVIKLLKVMRAQADPEERFLFPGKDHGVTMLRRFWDRVRVEAKLPDVRLHDIRRTIASWAVSSGVSMLAVSKMLAHSSIAVTEGHYAHLQDHAGRAAAETVAKLIEQHSNGTT